MPPVFSRGQEISCKRWELVVERDLGSGAFGTVYQVKEKGKQTTFALKTIKCSSQNIPPKVLREASTLGTVRHERIVQLIGFDQCQLSNGTYFVILTEFCAGGDLNSRLNRASNDTTNLKWILQISEALSYLHSRSIVHRDLKADNILLTDTTTENLKIGDFGLAREYEALKNAGNRAKEIETYYMTSGMGPIHWMAPEFYNERYTEKADIFSLGGIFYGIFSCDYIQMGSKIMYGVFVISRGQKMGLGKAMGDGDRDAQESQLGCSFRGSDPLKSLIRSMLQYDPRNRPTASDVQAKVKKIIDLFNGRS